MGWSGVVRDESRDESREADAFACGESRGADALACGAAGSGGREGGAARVHADEGRRGRQQAGVSRHRRRRFSLLSLSSFWQAEWCCERREQRRERRRKQRREQKLLSKTHTPAAFSQQKRPLRRRYIGQLRKALDLKCSDLGLKPGQSSVLEELLDLRCVRCGSPPLASRLSALSSHLVSLVPPLSSLLHSVASPPSKSLPFELSSALRLTDFQSGL